MAYEINNTRGDPIVSVADKSVTAFAGISLVGKNFSGYGELLNENYIKILEHFASVAEPSEAIEGQVWYNATTKSLNVRTEAVWKAVGTSISVTEPITTAAGDLWWDDTNKVLKVYDNNASQWQEILFNVSLVSDTAGFGVSGATSVIRAGSAEKVSIEPTQILFKDEVTLDTGIKINKIAITAPATSATLALADGSTLTTDGAFPLTLTTTATTTATLPAGVNTLASMGDALAMAIALG